MLFAYHDKLKTPIEKSYVGYEATSEIGIIYDVVTDVGFGVETVQIRDFPRSSDYEMFKLFKTENYTNLVELVTNGTL